MQIGDLSRTRHSHEQGENAAFQALRILLVIGFMTGGLLALWLSAGSSASTGGMVAAAPPQILAGEQQIAELPKRAERVQVADAGPAETLAFSGSPAEAGYRPAFGSQASVPAPTTDPSPAAGEKTSAALTSVGEAFSKPEQTVAVSPSDIDMTGAVARQAGLAEPLRPQSPAGDRVDLNRASFEQLNALRGAGLLGRAIVRGRPYRSVDDLVKKKVMRRAVFEKIKDQVTVQ